MNNNIDQNKFNRETRRWAIEQKNAMRSRIAMLTNKGKHRLLLFKRIQGIKGNSSAIRNDKLINTLKTYTKKNFGLNERISYSYARHGYFIAVGSSRGHNKNTNPRKKIDWYNSILTANIPELAKIVAEHQANAVVSEIKA